MIRKNQPASSALVWFRRDLRNFDHAALYHALRDHDTVFCAFVFDTDILDTLPSRTDRRVEFIRASLVELDAALRQQGGALVVCHGPARKEIPRLAAQLEVSAVYTNRDYEPQAVERDAEVARRLAALDIAFSDFKDQVIFERDEVLTQAGKPFGVFTAYKNAWLRTVNDFYLRSYPVGNHIAQLRAAPQARGVPTLAELGFETSNLGTLRMKCGMSGGAELFDDFTERMNDYKDARDFPAVKGVSYLSTHLRFGTVSIRELARHAHQRGGAGAETWLSELIWRDFYHQILYHHPHVVEHAWKAEYDDIRWETGKAADELFATWCEARTGYPIVDAAMRQINQTGFMHNRLRMIVASFLTKDLGIHWLRGERYFAEHLNDYDLAANNGGWQWAASTGCDAQPYFRIFNPVTQSERFDALGKFIRRYLPELKDVPEKYIHAPWKMPAALQESVGVVIGRDYAAPIVDHAQAREATLARFKLRDRS
ncbi:deoxyribodipyrimidine photo-lyase [Uliginosibacterium sp. H3]|uniref:Deoxyribodipyrimidine photo-lyase n=1 Tax=Uliginosibacterium silvisoli TaxID=3114758 RepID=A0ABU6K307_9RHOO|nr:deoxyribodipyrimidine photo-lyase [Uliginosibacterium sp. H3]